MIDPQTLPECIGGYRLLREIGGGGCGLVFEAIHPQLQRRVAIKVLRGEYVQHPGMLSRFFDEALAPNLVRHPGLVDVIDHGRLPGDGPPYLIMEYLTGETFEARLERVDRRLHRDSLMALFQQVAETMAAAHAKGVVHRDLKPSNVMIVSAGWLMGGECIKVLDFGIARLTGVSGGPGRDRTAIGVVFGTPGYMSPEQCHGARDVDDRGDVYSLGIMLYEALAGRRPFHSELFAELMLMTIRATPAPLQEVDPSIPAELATLVAAMIEKQPTLRPPMTHVADRLQSICAASLLRRSASAATPPGATEATSTSGGAGGGRAEADGAGTRAQRTAILPPAAGTRRRSSGDAARWLVVLAVCLLGSSWGISRWHRTQQAKQACEDPRGQTGQASLAQGRACMTACEQGSGPHCLAAAEWLLKSGGDPADTDRALPLLNRSCQAGQAQVCSRLARAYETGKGGLKKDDAQAVALYKKGCDGGNPDGCTRLGIMYSYGRGKLKQDQTQAAALYKKGCDGGHANGCTNLGIMYANGQGGLKQDAAQAVTLYKMGCDGGHANGCTNLGIMYANGQGGLRKDEAQAVTLYKKCCDGGHANGCTNLGLMYDNGLGDWRRTRRRR